MGSCGHRAWVLVAAAGCYAPSPASGIACSDHLECPTGQACDVDASGGPTCFGDVEPAPGKGDDPGSTPGPNNDLPGAAIDVSAGGAFAFDLAAAHDDASSPCGGGPDVFYRLTLDAPEVIYLDTFGSLANVAVAVRAGGCTEAGAVEACVDDSCGGAQVQGAWNLAAGDHCIVVERVDAAAGSTGALAVVRGKRTGDPLPGSSGTVSGDTCKDDNSNHAGCGCEPAEDHHYFFTVCPGAAVSAHVETCDGADWDTVLQLRSSANLSLGCTDDSCGPAQSTLTRMIGEPGLYWAIIDGCNECGPYTMAYSF